MCSGTWPSCLWLVLSGARSTKRRLPCRGQSGVADLLMPVVQLDYPLLEGKKRERRGPLTFSACSMCVPS
jgi:hypothetical protein